MDLQESTQGMRVFIKSSPDMVIPLVGSDFFMKIFNNITNNKQYVLLDNLTIIPKIKSAIDKFYKTHLSIYMTEKGLDISRYQILFNGQVIYDTQGENTQKQYFVPKDELSAGSFVVDFYPSVVFQHHEN